MIYPYDLDTPTLNPGYPLSDNEDDIECPSQKQEQHPRLSSPFPFLLIGNFDGAL